MSARLPLQAKTPFVLDPRPLEEAASPHAGALATSRVYRSLGLPDLIAANLRLRQRQRRFDESQMIETILLQTLGEDCPEDVSLVAQDPGLERGLGYRPPKATALPGEVIGRYFRGDSVCHESGLLDWVKDPQRAQEPGGAIARMEKVWAVFRLPTQATAAVAWGRGKGGPGGWRGRLRRGGVTIERITEEVSSGESVRLFLAASGADFGGVIRKMTCRDRRIPEPSLPLPVSCLGADLGSVQPIDIPARH